ncbi:hypothetical protein F5Y11DRAFT_137945 [Daldinia sp. FL1419]|nr:hypothetical protein F5Y11DRAFT_137945 [Daldinia sp. FL1419]
MLRNDGAIVVVIVVVVVTRGLFPIPKSRTFAKAPNSFSCVSRLFRSSLVGHARSHCCFITITYECNKSSVLLWCQCQISVLITGSKSRKMSGHCAMFSAVSHVIIVAF